MAHDRAIMNNSNPKYMVCLNELTFGKAIPYSYTRFMRDLTSTRIARTAFLGTKFSVPDALRLNIIQDTYNSDETMHQQITTFVKERALIGKFRKNFKTSKQNMQRDLINVLNNAEQYNFSTLDDAQKMKEFLEPLLEK